MHYLEKENRERKQPAAVSSDVAMGQSDVDLTGKEEKKSDEDQFLPLLEEVASMYGNGVVSGRSGGDSISDVQAFHTQVVHTFGEHSSRQMMRTPQTVM